MKKTEGDGWADRLACARLRKFPTTWQAARALYRLDPGQLPDAKTLHRYWSERWETGRIRPNRTYRELIERLLDSPGLFQDPPGTPTAQYPVVLAGSAVQAVQPVASYARINPPTVGDARFAPRDGLGREVRMTADESAEHAAMSGAQVSDRTMEQLHDDIVGLARGYTHRPLPEIFSAARQTRDIAVRLIDHTRRPSQLADLYVIAGQACGLLSTAAFDMGYWDAAARLAGAGLTYADTAGHNSLRGWSLGMRAFVANWQGRLDDADTDLAAALTVVPSGTAAVRILAFRARTRALMGDAEGTRVAVDAAEMELDDDGRDELHDGIGGEFGFTKARQEVDAGSAFVTLHDGVTAESYSQRALVSYGALPPEEQLFYAVNAARVDTASARIMKGDLSGARDALGPVFVLPSTQRTAGLTGRLGHVRLLLADPAFRSSRASRQLMADIEDFGSDTAERAIPEADL